MCDHDMPIPSTSPRITSTTQAMAERLLTSSQPRLTIHQTIEPNRASISNRPSAPVAASVERTNTTQAITSRRPTTTSSGCTAGKPSTSQW